MAEIPVSAVDLILKQVNVDDLGDLGIAAMQAAFEPFMAWKPRKDVIQEALDATPTMLGGGKIKAGTFLVFHKSASSTVRALPRRVAMRWIPSPLPRPASQ